VRSSPAPDRNPPGISQRIPERPTLDGLETRWSERWETGSIYRFDRSRTRPEIFSIDTPPPTASGALHVGSAFSYTHTDIIARFKRMRGLEVFYPMGWDDNGLPTERRVQNHYNVRCDPALPPETDLTCSQDGPPRAISRPSFVALCHKLTLEDERAFERMWRMLGLSVDWSLTYTTIGERARRAAQASFLDLLERGIAYDAQAPTLWDPDFETAVSQAELEDRTVRGAYHRVRFGLRGGGEVWVETSRPELLAACVALVFHPDDERYRHLAERHAVTPLFHATVPILAHPLCDAARGTGLAMVCTFGDVSDIVWWRDLDLPARAVIAKDGRIAPGRWGAGWDTADPESGRLAHSRIEGLLATAARTEIARMLAASGDMSDPPRAVEHAVKFYEKGARPLEILTTRQWFISTTRFRDELIELGRRLEWHPPHMRSRYEDWVLGLNGDWCISRQRHFGVPFPLWYSADPSGAADRSRPILPSRPLPVDPSSDVPPGFQESDRGSLGGFVADPDVMDTWATSSLTPRIAGGGQDDPDLLACVYPMDLRPQGHDIIRTWLFTSVLRAHLDSGELPFRHVAISGFIVDPGRKKISKSMGNALTPEHLIETHGADGVRYWAAKAQLGVDATFDQGQIKIGRRLAVKLLNASRLVAGLANGAAGALSEPLDRDMLAGLQTTIADATEQLEAYEHSRALHRIEASFWDFCDNYLELVKPRAYGELCGPGMRSAHAALRAAIAIYQRLLAPFMPYVCEETWSWSHQGSVHRARWPVGDELAAGSATGCLDVATAALAAVRKAKSDSRQKLRAPLTTLTVRDTPPRIALLQTAAGDLRAAANARSLALEEGEELAVQLLPAPGA
jgi:valyl-tRNA synthetase